MDIQAVAGQGVPQQQAAPAEDGTAPAAATSPPEPLPAAPPQGAVTPDDRHQTLSSTVAQLFSGQGGKNGSQTHPVQVSYKIEGGDIVTVFTDPKSGKEIAQFPSEMMIQFAQFFAKESGVTLDRSA